MSRTSILVVFLLIGLTAAAGQTVPVKAFVGAKLIDPAGQSIDNAVVLVRGGRVEAAGSAKSVKAPRGAEIVDLKGKYLIPGLISTHVHISDIQGTRAPAYTEENTMRQLALFARYGITTVWSLGGEKEPAFKAREMQNSPALNRSRIYLSGDVVTGKTPDEARAKVKALASAKVDVIKIRVDDQLGTQEKMKPEVYKAVIDEAHKNGLRLAAHIFYLEDAKELLRSGADFIAHSVRDKEIDDEFIALMKKRDVPYCPTFTRELATFAYASTPRFFSDPFFLNGADHDVIARLQDPKRQETMRTAKTAIAYKAALPTAQRNLKKAVDAGIRIAMGTDTGAQPERFQGYFEHLEMEMMAEAGMTPAQVLRSATTDAARTMKLDSVGRITKGTWADFVVLEQDPLSDIRNTKSVASVYIAGNAVKR